MSNPLHPLQEPKQEADLTRKILRSINDTVRLLDDIRGRAQVLPHLFTPTARVLRSKLHELCARFTLIGPNVNSRRGEETLWKKGYHDVFVAAKRLKKEGEIWDEEESALVRGLLLSGIGHYQHLIFRLQADYALSIERMVDFSMTLPDDGLNKGKSSAGRAVEAPWANEMARHCLLYMGDLSRYLREIEVGCKLGVAERFYTQAAWLMETDGRSHNQLGTLATGKLYGLDSVYHYMRSICCPNSFPGAEGNLTKVLEKNWTSLELETLAPVPPSLAQRTIMRMLLLVDVWYCGRHVNNIQLHCSEVVEGFAQLIQSVPTVPKLIEKNDNNHIFAHVEPTNNISSAVALKMFSLLFMSWNKLEKTESCQGTALAATLLAMIGSVIHEINARFEIFKVMRKKLRAKRRRRRHDSDVSSASDMSPNDTDIDSGDSPQVSSCDEEDVINGHESGTHGKSTWVGDELFSVLSIICEWLRYNQEAMNQCPITMKTLATNLIAVFNKLRAYAGTGQPIKLGVSKRPLPEDAFLRGVPGLATHQATLDWSLNHRQLTAQEEMKLRTQLLLTLGEHLPGIRIDCSKVFHLIEESKAETSPTLGSPKQECKGKLMKNMGQLWLKAEVKELESRMKKVNGVDYSPYLVVDVEALTDNIVLIKQLLGSRQFIVVIPTVVLSQLDESKKKSAKAREAIRWLESQFLHGNRHLRSQKAQERQSLGVIKYPKKKDTEAWQFFQMMECCNYLSKQSELRSKGGATVTFLTGIKDKTECDTRQQPNNAQDFSPSGLASTFGVTLESVETFHSKWKLTHKSHG